MDDGYTEHSGCPVTVGEKWITTLWMREGVSEVVKWQDSDPHGNKRKVTKWYINALVGGLLILMVVTFYKSWNKTARQLRAKQRRNAMRDIVQENHYQ